MTSETSDTYTARRRSTPSLVGAIMLLATVASSAYIAATARQLDAAEFSAHAEQVTEQIRNRLNTDIAFLRGAASLFSTERPISRTELSAYVRRLDPRGLNPGVHGIGFVERVRSEELGDLYRRMRSETGAFEIWPDSIREEYYPIVYLEPRDEVNAGAIGFDAWTDPDRRAALVRSRDSGRSVTTGVVQLVTGIAGSRGFTVYVPVYTGEPGETPEERSAALRGFAFAPFSASEMLSEISYYAREGVIDYAVYYSRDLTEDTLLYATSQNVLPGTRGASRLSVQNSLTVPGGYWTILVVPGPTFSPSLAARIWPFLLLGGLAISLILFVATTSEVRTREEAEARAIEVRRSEERYRLLFEKNPNCMYVYDADTLRFLDVNEATILHYGYERDEFLSMRLPDLLAKSERIEDQTAPHIESTHRRKDGSAILVDVVSNEVEFQHQRARLSLATDVTERRLLEEQLLQSQKLDSIGRLAGGVAHDFNNLLTAIFGYAELAEMKLDPDDPIAKDLRHIKRASESASGLTRQLLAFARKQVIEPRVFNIGELVTRIQPILARLLGEDIELEVNVDEMSCDVKADPGQVEQVIVNFVVNAKDAMPSGGRISIKIESAQIGEDVMRTNPAAQPGEYVIISVVDTGIGMDEAVISKIFEPFYTTKPVGLGTGLGLATSHGAIKQAGGFITVHSEEGKGSIFKAYLPCASEARTEKQPSQMPVERARPGEVVMVVEDEDTVRELATTTLKELGYEVLSATNAEDAVRVSSEYDGKIHLIVTDIVMPGLDGVQLARLLIDQRPDTKVLYTSGYTAKRLQVSEAEGAGLFMQKPYTINTLATKVRFALGYS